MAAPARPGTPRIIRPMSTPRRSTTASSPSKGEPGRVRLPAAERRLQLISAAQDAYRTYGVDGASVHKVAKVAGVNIATLYQHFASGGDLLEAALLSPIDEVLARELPEATARLEGRDREERLAELHRSLQGVMVQIGWMLNAILGSKNETAQDHFGTTVWPALVGWVTGVLVESGEADADATGPALVGSYLWLAMHSAYRDDRSAGADWAQRVAGFVFHGVEGAARTVGSARASS